MNQSPETFFGRTNKAPLVIVASGIKARSTRPKRGRRRRPSRKGRLRRRAPVKRTVSQKWRRKYNRTHLRDKVHSPLTAWYKPSPFSPDRRFLDVNRAEQDFFSERNDEFSNQNVNVDKVLIKSLNLNNEAVSRKKGQIGGRRRKTRRRRRRRRKTRRRRR